MRAHGVQLTVTVSADSTHVQPFQPGREPLPSNTQSLPYPLELTLLGKEDYFTQPAGMNIFGMLRSPMVLMMLVSGLLMWGMPKLLVRPTLHRKQTYADASAGQYRDGPGDGQGGGGDAQEDAGVPNHGPDQVVRPIELPVWVSADRQAIVDAGRRGRGRRRGQDESDQRVGDQRQKAAWTQVSGKIVYHYMQHTILQPELRRGTTSNCRA